MHENTNGHQNGSRVSTFALGLICGAAVGAAAGLLLAPKSGAELRSQLADSTERLRRSALDTYDQAADAVDGVVERGKKAVQKGRDTFDQVAAAARG